ncbi:MAG TPA: HDOD domain-containing protein [Candidatus Paceibacterota bacterium]|nr:HDOD domain-containing protein [Candidatus Paceibacterota bacterium]
MNIPTIADLISSIPQSLGSYAPVIQEIEAALESPECNLSSVGEAIEKEPDLTARLLRLGNSSFYGFSSRLTTVNEAISLIGIQQVQELILASSILENFAGVSDEFVSMESFWRHSLACGIGARLLAMEKRLPKPDRFFVAGLLHDVGRLVLFSQAPKVAIEVFGAYQKGDMTLREAELRVLGYDHQQIAEALMKLWKYPENLVQAVAFHHQPTACEKAPVEAAVVHLSDHLVNAMQIGTSGERHVLPLSARAWERLNLPLDVLGSVVENIDDQIEAVQAVFLSQPLGAAAP